MGNLTLNTDPIEPRPSDEPRYATPLSLLFTLNEQIALTVALNHHLVALELAQANAKKHGFEVVHDITVIDIRTTRHLLQRLTHAFAPKEDQS